VCFLILLADGSPHAAADTTPPTIPANLTATPVSSSQINLSWDASVDLGGSGLAGYHVYQDGVHAVATADTSISITGLVPSTSYCFSVAAYDNAGNSSPESAQTCANTAVPSCNYVLSASSASVSAAGGSGSVNVTASAGCSWAALSSYSWITITSGSSGTGSGTVSYSVTANPSTSLRIGTLIIAGQTFHVVQFGFLDASATFLWAQQAGGTAKDHAASIAADASGNLYVTGWFETNAIFGGLTLPNGDQRADVFVAKYSSTGTSIWARRGGGSSDDYATGVAVDSLGNVLVAGYFCSTNSDFGGLPMASAGSNDVFLVKYSPSGAFLWSKRFGGEGNDIANAIAMDAADNIYVTGSFSSSNVNFGGVILTSSGATDVFVAKYTPLGALLWAKGAGGSGSDSGRGVAVDSRGNVYVTGVIDSTNALFSGLPLPPIGGGTFLANYSASSGTIRWVQRSGGSGGDSGNSVASDNFGNVFVAGDFSSTNTDFGGGPLPYGGNKDIFLWKAASAGSYLWSQSFGGTDSESAKGLCVDTEGNAYVTGSFAATNTTGLLVAKYTTVGNLQWAKQARGPSNMEGYGVAADRSGNIYVTGDFDPPNGFFDCSTLMNSGSSDIFLAGLRPIPNPVGTPIVLVNGRYCPSGFAIPATNAIFVTITSSYSPARIYFKLDDSPPEPNAGHTEYLSSFAVSNTVTVWAAAYPTNFSFSDKRLAEPVRIEVVPVYALALSTPGGGNVSADTPGGQYLSNTLVQLSASPATGWNFLRWEGDASGTSLTQQVTMDQARSVQAIFGTFVTTPPLEGGSVLNWPSSGPYPFASRLRISAIPSNGWYFIQWVEPAAGQMVSPLIFEVTNAFPTVRAVFGSLPNSTTFALTTLVNGNGVVTKSPQQPNYPKNFPVTLTAAPAATFLGWSGDESGTNPVLTVSMDTNKTITANFTGGANVPPLISLFNPTNGATLRAPASVIVSATASDADTNGTIIGVNFYDGATLLGTRTNAPFDITWLSPATGTHILTAVGTDNGLLSATSAPVAVTIQAVPTFWLEHASYNVGEGEGSITVKVIKNASAAASVNFFTVNGTAVAVDFAATNTILSSGAGPAEWTITIPIHEDFYVENPPQYFEARIGAVDPTSTVVTNDKAKIYIIDNDASTNSFLTRVVTPIVNPATLPTLQIHLLQTNQQPVPLGQWRFTWDFDWRTNGSIVRGLPPANYEVEFKAVPGYIEPLRTVVSMTTNAQYVFFYTNTSLSQWGSLMVSIEPPFIATNSDPNLHGGWRLRGESAYRNGGTSLDGLNVGSYVVEFKPVTNLWTTPAARSVSVPANEIEPVTERYYVADLGPGRPPNLLDFVSEVNGSFPDGYPYVFCGQLQSDLGYGSGCAVKERIVLTAAHVVFDAEAMSCAPGVNWFFQRQVGVYEPPPQVARGACVLSGYADRRNADPTPGISSPATKDRDIAVVYFLSAAAGHGFSGYLVSHTPGEWLFNSSQETLVGYPVEVVAEPNRGRMHATPIARLSWNQEFNQVFYTTNIVAYPGMSGGPLCAHVVTNNTSAFYPAAVFLGGNGRTTVRAIDSEVAELINAAESLADSGQDNTGPIKICPGCTGDPNFEGLVNVNLLPSEVTNYGAAYRFTWNDNGIRYSDWYDEEFAQFKDYSGTSYKLQFKRLTNSNFITPNDLPVSFDKNQPKQVLGIYQAFGALQAMPDSKSNVLLLGSSGSLYRVEHAIRLPGSSGPSGVWTPMRTQRLNSSSAVLTNVFPPGTTNRFLRAVLQPQP